MGALQVLPFTQLKSGSNMLANIPFQLVPKAQSRMARWAHGFISSFSIVYIYKVVVVVEEEEEEEEQEEEEEETVY